MPLIPTIFWYCPGFCHFIFSDLAMSVGRGSDVHVVLGLGMGKMKNLMACLVAGMVAGFWTGVGTGI